MSDVALSPSSLTIEVTEPIPAEAAASDAAAELAEVSPSSPAAAAPQAEEPTSEDSASITPPPALAAGRPAILTDQRASFVAAVSAARDLPPGVRERLAKLVEQSSILDATGEPLLATRGVLDLLAQGLPAVLRRESPTAVSRLEHPAGDMFFASSGDELSDQQAEQIARTQLQRAGLLG